MGFLLRQLNCVLGAYDSEGLLFFSSSAKSPDPSSESSHGNTVIISFVLHLLRQTQEVLQYNLTVQSETHLLFMSLGCEASIRLPSKWDEMYPASSIKRHYDLVFSKIVLFFALPCSCKTNGLLLFQKSVCGSPFK